MRRLVMWNAVTLDGYFEGRESWSLDWHEEIWGDELEQFSLVQLRGAAMLLFGRVTYEGMAAYWTTAEGEIATLMNELPKMVFSRTLSRAEWAPSTLVREAEPAAVQRLKEEGDGELLVFGSGTTLFGRGLPRHTLELLETRPLASGAVLLRYGAGARS